jgi:transposase
LQFARLSSTDNPFSGNPLIVEGAQIFCRIRGYLSTLKKEGHNLLDALKQVFGGQPIFPSLQPE